MTSITTIAIPPFALYDGDLVSTTVGAGAANTAYLVGVVLRVPATLTGVRVRFGSGGAGHYDVGIYDASGANGAPNNLLAHAASSATALATSTGTATPALIGGNLSLRAGRYWLALWLDNATDTVNRVQGSNSMAVLQSGTTTGPLPALASSLTALANGTFKPMIIGLLSGGWS